MKRLAIVLALLGLLMFGDMVAWAGTSCAMHMQIRPSASCGK